MRFLTSEMLTMEGVSGSNSDWKLSMLTKIVSILRLTCFLERPEASQVLSGKVSLLLAPSCFFILLNAGHVPRLVGGQSCREPFP